MVDNIINQLSYYITNEVRMPAGFVRDVIDEIERLHEEINNLRLQVVRLSIPKEPCG